MDPDNQERKIDTWLQDALARYGSVEPRAGLEQRVLANLRSEEREARRRRWTLWAPAVATAAAVIMVTAVAYLNRQPSPRVAVPSPIASKPGPTAPPGTREGGRRPEPATAGVSGAKAAGSVPLETAAGAEAPGAGTEVGALAPAGKPEPAVAMNGVTPKIRAASPPASSPHRAGVFPAPAPLSEQERLAIAAIRFGLTPPPKPQMPPGDELLPQVDIPEIRIVPLRGPEQS